jgi:opacity protein-like surface antigen
MKKRRVIPPLYVCILAFLSFPPESAAQDQEDDSRRGFYFGMQAGVSLPGEYESTRTNTRSVPTNCDQWLPGEILNDGTPVPLPLSECSPRHFPGSPNGFELGEGILAGVQAGYVLRALRIEVELFRRGQSGAFLPLVIPGDAKQAEFVERSEKISDFRTDNLFANLYYDFRGMLSPTATPYVGVGAGLVRQKLFYSAVSVRTNDRERMRQLGRNSHAAGLASLADATLSDRVFSYQFLAGVDYAMDDRLSAGLKLRYGRVGEFMDGENPWRLLRGHESTVGPTSGTGYDMPIHYEIMGSPSHFWGVTLGLRYRIGA